MLESLQAFKEATAAEQMPTSFHGKCSTAVQNISSRIRTYAAEHNYSTFQESYSLTDARRNNACKDFLQSTLDKGYNIKAVFVHNIVDQGLCNAMRRQDKNKRFQKVETVIESFEQAGDGNASRACLAALTVPKGLQVTWTYCDNRDMKMTCEEPEPLGKLAERSGARSGHVSAGVAVAVSLGVSMALSVGA